MTWHLECKRSGVGETVEGDLDVAVLTAMEKCLESHDRWVIWLEPSQLRMAEVTQQGFVWLRTKLQGEELVRLMRRYHWSIRELAMQLGLTQRRIREARSAGLADPLAVRDWLQAITSMDVGPLPERYRICRRIEEADCGECGCPLQVGDQAYEYVGGIFCSVNCCRASRRAKL